MKSRSLPLLFATVALTTAIVAQHVLSDRSPARAVQFNMGELKGVLSSDDFGILNVSDPGEGNIVKALLVDEFGNEFNAFLSQNGSGNYDLKINDVEQPQGCVIQHRIDENSFGYDCSVTDLGTGIPVQKHFFVKLSF